MRTDVLRVVPPGSRPPALAAGVRGAGGPDAIRLGFRARGFELTQRAQATSGRVHGASISVGGVLSGYQRSLPWRSLALLAAGLVGRRDGIGVAFQVLASPVPSAVYPVLRREATAA